MYCSIFNSLLVIRYNLALEWNSQQLFPHITRIRSQPTWQFCSKQCFGRLGQELKERFLHNVILFKGKALVLKFIHCFCFCFLLANISIHDEAWGNVETLPHWTLRKVSIFTLSDESHKQHWVCLWGNIQNGVICD